VKFPAPQYLHIFRRWSIRVKRQIDHIDCQWRAAALRASTKFHDRAVEFDAAHNISRVVDIVNVRVMIVRFVRAISEMRALYPECADDFFAQAFINSTLL